MGEVYRARDPSLERDVAIKLLPESVLVGPEHLARFQREASATRSLHQPIDEEPALPRCHSDRARRSLGEGEM